MTIRTARTRRRRWDLRKAALRSVALPGRALLNEPHEPSEDPFTHPRVERLYLIVDRFGEVHRDLPELSFSTASNYANIRAAELVLYLLPRLNGAYVLKNRSGNNGEFLEGDAVEALIREVSEAAKAAMPALSASVQP